MAVGAGVGVGQISDQAKIHGGLESSCQAKSVCGRGLAIALLAAWGACAPGQANGPMAEVSGDAATVNPGVAMTAMGSIHGVVASTDGTVYEGVRVELEMSHEDDPAIETEETDSGGAFNFAGLAAGEFKLTISSQGFVTQKIAGVLHAGEAFDARTIVLPVAGASSFIEVSGGSRAEIAQEELNFEEKQRVLGFFPNYYVSYQKDAPPLTWRQKYQLAWKTTIDPVTFAMAGSVAAFEQATNVLPGYGQGAQGYGKRLGANYADGFTGTMLGGAVLPAIFKQDPRYFYKGTGSIASRAFYAIANAVVCKGDNGHWQFNYSGLAGGVAAGSISNLYYPAGDRSGVELTFENAGIGTAESAVQNLFQEFVVRRLTPRLAGWAPKTP